MARSVPPRLAVALGRRQMPRFTSRVGGGSAFFVMSRNTKAVLVAVPVILILLAVAIPNFTPPRTTVSLNSCAVNLTWFQKAKVKWAYDLNKPDTAVATEEDLAPILMSIGARITHPSCPSGGTYTLGPVTEPVRCSVNQPGHILPSDWKK